MLRRFVAAAFVGLAVMAAPAQAASDPPATYRVPVAESDAAGVRVAVICALSQVRESDELNFYFHLSAAAVALFGRGGEVGAASTTTRDGKLCVAVYTIADEPPPKPLEMGVTVSHGAAPLSTARSAVEIGIRGTCPFKVKVKNQSGRRCTPGRVDFVQIFGTQANRNACDIFIDHEFPIQGIDLSTDWKGVPRLAGQETTLPPGQVVPALLELGCGKSTSRSRALARGIGVLLPVPLTQPSTARCLVSQNFVVSGAGTPRTGFRSFGLRVSFPRGSKLERARLVDVATEERPTADALGEMLRWEEVQRDVSGSAVGFRTREYLVNVSYRPNERGFALSRQNWRFSIAYEPPSNTAACAARAAAVRR